MKNVYGVDQKIEHYGCMVDLLGKEGKLVEAEELVKGMPWKPDIVILGALLAACKNNRNTKVAKRVVKEILTLEPHNHGVHVAAPVYWLTSKTLTNGGCSCGLTYSMVDTPLTDDYGKNGP
ncbi:hypothetical protein HN51_016678 [Arachis hypogaea]|nr:Pentatricopeptide repeat-containing protein [Arachis hypogaea]